jgi:hypothetical protein
VWIAFVDRNFAVALVHSDGSGFHELPGTRANPGTRVAWSPDGEAIAYGDLRSSGLSVARVDGLRPTLLVPYLGDNALGDPAWSPDGTRIAFFDNADVCVGNSDGTDIGRLTYSPVTPFAVGVSRLPAWQPRQDGTASAGPPGVLAGPARTWNRSHSWYPACGVIWQGLAVTTSGARRVAAGNRASIRLTVTNRSDTPLGTSGLVGVAAQLHGGVFLRVSASQGRCAAPRQTRHFDCELGALWPHESALVKLQVRAGGGRRLVLRCYLPRPASAASPARPDCVRQLKIRSG